MEFYKAVESLTISMTDEIENGCANFVHMHEKGDRLACLVTINLGLSYSRHSGSSTVTDSFYTEMSCELVMKCCSQREEKRNYSTSFKPHIDI